MTAPSPAAWEVYADVTLQRAALTMRLTRGEPARPLAGLVIDDDEIATILAELPGLHAPAPEQLVEIAESTAADVDSAAEGLVSSVGSGPFGTMAWNAGLDVPSLQVFALAAAVELDPARQRLASYLNDDVSRRWLTPAVVHRLLGPDGVAALSTDAPLARACLVSVEGDTTWSLRAVRIAPSIAAALAGAPGHDLDLPRGSRLHEHDDGTGANFVLVHGGDRLARIELAATTTAGTRFVVTRLPATDAEWAALVRQCVVGGTSVVIDLGDGDLGDDGRWWIDRIVGVPVAVCSESEIKLRSLPERRFAEFRAGEYVEDVGSGHLLDRDQARLAAKALDSVDGDAAAAVRRLVTGNLDRHAQRTRPGRGWDELVLPEERIATLRELVARFRHRRRVFHEWGFPARPSTGVTALFAGPSGTGKTLTAQVVATDLELDLYRVDLSAVVSKYIGETEKNLEDIFRASGAGNMVLFFDEADALFGKRSDVSDAHDRYANIETAYLLQRVEHYDGFVILATNLRNNIDSAFLRRIDVAIEFELPDRAQRRAIWDRVFPAAAPMHTLDRDLLADEFEVSGGVIRNAAVHAAFLAAEAATTISMDHVLLGMEREFQKMGRLRSARDFSRLRPVADGAEGIEGIEGVQDAATA